MKGRTSPVDTARTALAEALELQGRWDQEAADAEAKLQAHEAGAGAQLLANSGGFDDLIEGAEKLRHQVRYANEARKMAAQAVGPARSAVLDAAATEVEARRDRAQRALSAHRARTDQLAAALLDHEGGNGLALARRWWYHPEDDHGAERIPGGTVYRVPRSVAMEKAVLALADLRDELQTAAARDLTDAQLRGLLIKAFPDGPEAAEAEQRRAEAERAHAARQAEQARHAAVRQAIRDRIEKVVGPNGVTTVTNSATHALSGSRLQGEAKERERLLLWLEGAIRPAEPQLRERALRAKAEAQLAEITAQIDSTNEHGTPAMAGAREHEA